jgi:hypothetical protein
MNRRQVLAAIGFATAMKATPASRDNFIGGETGRSDHLRQCRSYVGATDATGFGTPPLHRE